MVSIQTDLFIFREATCKIVFKLFYFICYIADGLFGYGRSTYNRIQNYNKCRRHEYNVPGQTTNYSCTRNSLLTFIIVSY